MTGAVERMFEPQPDGYNQSVLFQILKVNVVQMIFDFFFVESEHSCHRRRHQSLARIRRRQSNTSDVRRRSLLRLPLLAVMVNIVIFLSLSLSHATM
jgi:hypothetical protein